MYEFQNRPQEKPSPRDLTRLDNDQRDAWEERVAICVIDGGLSETEAEAVAWREIEAAQDAHGRPCAARAAEGVPEGQGGCRVVTRANVGYQGT